MNAARIAARVLRAAGVAGALGASIIAAPAQAALFEDAEARRYMLDVMTRVEVQGRELGQRLDQLSARIDRLEAASAAADARPAADAEIAALRQDIARLRTALETRPKEARPKEARPKEAHAREARARESRATRRAAASARRGSHRFEERLPRTRA